MFVSSLCNPFDTHLLLFFRADHDDVHIDCGTCGIQMSIDLVEMPCTDHRTWLLLLHMSNDLAGMDDWHSAVAHTVLESCTLELEVVESSLLLVDT